MEVLQEDLLVLLEEVVEVIQFFQVLHQQVVEVEDQEVHRLMLEKQEDQVEEVLMVMLQIQQVILPQLAPLKDNQVQVEIQDLQIILEAVVEQQQQDKLVPQLVEQEMVVQEQLQV